MLYIKEANKAIDAAGGNHALAEKLAKKTGLSEAKLYGRIRMWRVNGVALQFIRVVARLGKTTMGKLIP